MRVTIRIESGLDATNIKKRAMWITVDTQGPLGAFTAVGEMPDFSPMAKEVDMIVNDILNKKRLELKDKYKKVRTKRKATKKK